MKNKMSMEIAEEVMRKLSTMNMQPQNERKPKMEFSKKLIIGAFIFYGLIGIVSLVAWFLTGDWPREIAEFFILPIIGLVGYMIKSAIENRAKIQKGREDTT